MSLKPATRRRLVALARDRAAAYRQIQYLWLAVAERLHEGGR